MIERPDTDFTTIEDMKKSKLEFVKSTVVFLGGIAMGAVLTALLSRGGGIER